MQDGSVKTRFSFLKVLNEKNYIIKEYSSPLSPPPKNPLNFLILL